METLMSLPAAIYLLSASTSLVACGLLLRHYLQRRTRLLLWSCIGFFGLATNNVLVYVDLVVVAEVNLAAARTLVGAAAMIVMLAGFIWETSG
jgi:hypothetical protein